MKNIILIVCLGLMVSLARLQGQTVLYSNPMLENERAHHKNPFYLIGFLGNNMLIGKVNEKGFYISVYNNKMGILNNVYYKELDLRSFDIMDAVNFNDVGLLFVRRKAARDRLSILYSITFSDTGVPVREADPLDTLPSGWGNEVFHRILISDSRQYIFIGSWNARLSEHNFRGVLLNADGQVVRKVAHTLMGGTDWLFKDARIDNEGNVYLLMQSRRDDYVQGVQLYTLFSGSSVFRQQGFSLEKHKVEDINMGVDNFSKRLFFYGLYKGLGKSGKVNLGGLYGVWLDMGGGGFYGEKLWKMNEFMPDLKPAQLRNLVLKGVVFLKNKGWVASCEIRYIVQNGGSPITHSYITPGGVITPFIGIGGGFYGQMPLGSGFSSFGSASSTVEYYAENAYVFEMDAQGNIGAKYTLYKNQMQREGTSYIGYNLFNTGSQLNFIYNDFQTTGNMFLSAYVLDPKHHFVKKVLSPGQDQHFSLMISEGKQIAPFAYLAPYLFKDEWRGFALIVL